MRSPRTDGTHRSLQEVLLELKQRCQWLQGTFAPLCQQAECAFESRAPPSWHRSSYAFPKATGEILSRRRFRTSVASEARHATGSQAVVVRSLTRWLRLVREKNRVRVEVVATQALEKREGCDYGRCFAAVCRTARFCEPPRNLELIKGRPLGGRTRTSGTAHLRRLPGLELEQFLRVLDHLRIPFASLLHKRRRLFVRAAQGETQDRTADNRYVVRFLVLQLQERGRKCPTDPTCANLQSPDRRCRSAPTACKRPGPGLSYPTGPVANPRRNAPPARQRSGA